MEKESVVRLRITREEKVLLHKGRVFRIVLPDVPVRLFFLSCHELEKGLL